MKLIPFLKPRKKVVAFKCSCCGKEYDTLPLCFGADFPDFYYSVPPEERTKRVEKTKSLCVVDGKHFFHRGRLTIPIKDYVDSLLFDVWTSISEDNFSKRMDLWDNPLRMDQPAYFGWLQTIVPTYGNTLNIKAMAIEQKPGVIPEIVVFEEGHQLKIDQENGIFYNIALQIVGEIIVGLHKKNS